MLDRVQTSSNNNNTWYKYLLPTPTQKAAKRTYNYFLYHLNNFHHSRWQKACSREPVLHKPIFIIGCPRSGTSIFVKLFATHPHVANWSEAGLIWDPMDFYNKEAEHLWEDGRVTVEEAKRLHSQFEWYRQKKKKARFVNKHPRNSVRIKYIKAVFPDAFFIHIVRDGRAVVRSIVSKINQEPDRQNVPFGGFCKPPDWRRYYHDDLVVRSSLQWLEITKYILSCRQQLENRYLELRYEDFCREPRDVFAKVFEFSGLPHTQTDLSSIPKKLNNMNTNYNEYFSGQHLDNINMIQKELLNQLGYRI